MDPSTRAPLIPESRWQVSKRASLTAPLCEAQIAIVVRRNLTVWNAAIYCTLVVRDMAMVSLR